MKPHLGALQIITGTGEYTIDLWAFLPECGYKQLHTLLDIVATTDSAEKFLAQIDECSRVYIAAMRCNRDNRKAWGNLEWIATHFSTTPQGLNRKVIGDRLEKVYGWFTKWTAKNQKPKSGKRPKKAPAERNNKETRIAWDNMYRYALAYGMDETAAAAYASNYFPGVKA